MDRSKFSPRELAILDCLADGFPHSRDEIMKAIGVDETTGFATIRVTISKMRPRLARIGQDIVCRMVNSYSTKWQRIRLLASAHDGKR